MKLESVFPEGHKIPPQFTCDGTNVNPKITIHDVPLGAKSLALIMDDPDIPEFVKEKYGITVFDHWVLFNILPTVTGIAEGQEPGIKGNNGAGKPGYIGPCPPDREHRYFFRLFALDCTLPLSEGASKADVLTAMKGHIIAEAQLMGRYERKQ